MTKQHKSRYFFLRGNPEGRLSDSSDNFCSGVAFASQVRDWRWLVALGDFFSRAWPSGAAQMLAQHGWLRLGDIFFGTCTFRGGAKSLELIHGLKHTTFSQIFV